MSVATVITDGFGSFGSVALVITMGYAVAEEPAGTPVAQTETVVRSMGPAPLIGGAGKAFDSRIQFAIDLAKIQVDDDEVMELLALYLGGF